jgi:uncharacterized DUF497 family protein
MIRFEWDPRKDLENQRKHGVSFAEARTVFFDEQAVQFFDEAHDEDEDRFIMLGMSGRLRVLVVRHCERQAGQVLRIISARRATKTERQFYAGDRL